MGNTMYAAPVRKFKGLQYKVFEITGIAPVYKTKKQVQPVIESFKSRGFSTRIVERKSPTGQVGYVLYVRKK